MRYLCIHLFNIESCESSNIFHVHLAMSDKFISHSLLIPNPPSILGLHTPYHATFALEFESWYHSKKNCSYSSLFPYKHYKEEQSSNTGQKTRSRKYGINKL